MKAAREDMHKSRRKFLIRERASQTCHKLIIPTFIDFPEKNSSRLPPSLTKHARYFVYILRPAERCTYIQEQLERRRNFSSFSSTCSCAILLRNMFFISAHTNTSTRAPDRSDDDDDNEMWREAFALVLLGFVCCSSGSQWARGTESRRNIDRDESDGRACSMYGVKAKERSEISHKTENEPNPSRVLVSLSHAILVLNAFQVFVLLLLALPLLTFFRVGEYYVNDAILRSRRLAIAITKTIGLTLDRKRRLNCLFAKQEVEVSKQVSIAQKSIFHNFSHSL